MTFIARLKNSALQMQRILVSLTAEHNQSCVKKAIKKGRYAPFLLFIIVDS